MRAAILLLGCLVGCGDDRIFSPVVLHTGDSPLIAVDPLGDGQWQRLPPNTHPTVEVGPRWITATVCGTADRRYVIAQAYSDLDGADVTLLCRAEPDNLIDVPVTVVGNGWINVEIGAYHGAFGEGTYPVSVLPGTWDVVAYGFDNILAPVVIVMHDVTIEEGSALTLDFGRDGVPLEQREVEVADPLGEVSLYGYVDPERAESFWLQAFLPEGVVGLVPDAVLDDGDLSYLAASSSDGRGAFHGNWLLAHDGALQVDLPPALPSAELALEPMAATWPADTAWTSASLSLQFPWSDSSTDGYGAWSYYDDAGAATGEIEFPDVAAIPGWNPAWSPTPTRSRTVRLSLSGAPGYVGWSRTFAP